MKTTVLIFPFDQFGSAGTSSGAQLLGDAVRELLEETRAETRPTRSHCFKDQIRIKEFTFENMDDLSRWQKTGRNAVRQVWKQEDFLVFLGGNHLGVLPVYEELGADALVIQLDAHLDIYNLSDCTEEPSHGNFLLHAQGELPHVINLGHRDLFLIREHIEKHYHKTISALEVIHEPAKTLTMIEKELRKAKRVFLDIDCDVFDPAFFPATTHPLPFGLSPAIVPQLIGMIEPDRFAGIAISEFEPGRDRADQGLNTLGWLLEWLFLRRYE